MGDHVYINFASWHFTMLFKEILDMGWEGGRWNLYQEIGGSFAKEEVCFSFIFTATILKFTYTVRGTNFPDIAILDNNSARNILRIWLRILPPCFHSSYALPYSQHGLLNQQKHLKMHQFFYGGYSNLKSHGNSRKMSLIFSLSFLLQFEDLSCLAL